MIIKSQIIPLPLTDVDTDLIIPADFLKTTTKEGLGQYAFQRLKDADPNFPFNKPEYQTAKILVAYDNFGCGSSREHAAWALADYGIKAIIAPSFADIFFNNALKNGLVPIQLKKEDVDQILKIHDITEINVETQEITLPEGQKFKFDLDPYRKHCLINNMDDLDYILSNEQEIRNFSPPLQNELN